MKEKYITADDIAKMLRLKQAKAKATIKADMIIFFQFLGWGFA